MAGIVAQITPDQFLVISYVLAIILRYIGPDLHEFCWCWGRLKLVIYRAQMIVSLCGSSVHEAQKSRWLAAKT